MVINPLIGVYIAIISYPVIKGGVSLTPQYTSSTQRHIYRESQDLMSAGRISTVDASISRTKNGVLGALPKTNMTSAPKNGGFEVRNLQTPGGKPLFSGGPHLLLVSGSVSIPEFGSNQRCGGPDHPLVGPHPSKLNKRLLLNIYHFKK